MRNSVKILLTLSLCLLLAGSLAFAEENEPAPDQGPGGGMFGFLDAENSEAVREAIKEHFTAAYPTMQLLKAREAELNILIFSENQDEAAIQAKIAEINDIQAQLYAQRIQLRRAIYAITGMPVPDMDRGFGPGFRHSNGPGRGDQGRGGPGGQGGQGFMPPPPSM